jgi:von Willebrand factor type A domain
MRFLVKLPSHILPLACTLLMVGCSANDGSSRDGAGGTAGRPATGGSAGAPVTGNGGTSNGGSSGGTSAGSGGSSSTGAGGNIISTTGDAGDLECGRRMFEVHPKPAEILIVLDRSASMLDPPDGATASTSKWDLVVPAVKQVVADTSATVSWGLKTFPEGQGSECAAGSVTGRIDVQVATMNAAAVNAQVDLTTAQGNGTPTGDAIHAATAYLQTITTSNPKYILLATDGEPSCPSGTAARTFAVQAVTDAAAAGFKTFVVGVSTTSNTASMTLTQLATAGGEARSDPNPLATRYYLANTKDEIVSSLKQITGVVASCSFDLGAAPPVPDNIAVKIDGVKAPQDSTNGWAYTSADHTAIQVFGAMCDTIKASANAVQIIFGCKGDVIN